MWTPSTLTISAQTKDAALMRDVGAVCITIAVVANSVVKSCIAAYSGGWRFGRLVGAILLGATGMGLWGLAGFMMEMTAPICMR